MNGTLAGRAVFISGGAKGLGRAIAIGLASDGAFVGISDIDAEVLAQTEAEIRTSGGKVHAASGDLGRQDDFARAADGFAAAAGSIDVMINNASYLVYEPVENVSERTLDRMIGAGFKSAVWGSQALLRHRRADQPANIIMFSSPVAFRGYPNSSIYSAIKSATTSLTRTLSAELGPKGVRVNAVAPGSVPTPGALQYVDAAEYERRAATIPMRRLGHEDDIVHAIRFLLSEGAAFVNGAVLAVDGGIIAAA